MFVGTPTPAQCTPADVQRVELNWYVLGKTPECQKTGKTECLLEKIIAQIFY